MKRISLVLAVVLVAGALLSPLTPKIGAEESKPQTEFVPGEILVQFETGVSTASIQDLLAERGLAITGEVRALGVKKVRVPEGEETGWILELRSDPQVKSAEPNYYLKVLGEPNDTYFDSQWGLFRIQAPEAWNITTGSDIVIAIIDTGVDFSHPDLDEKIVPGYDFVNDDPDPSDDHGHGTHVAGIAAAETNNGLGIAGISWEAKALPLKCFDADGLGTVFDAANGIEWAVDQGAKIINMSFGSQYPSSILEETVNYAWEKGLVLVAAAGNGGSDILHYPAAYENVISVSATDQNDNKAEFSTYGRHISVAAPGVNILSTTPDGYQSWSGTSMACPHVVGLAALIWSVDSSSLTNTEVRGIIEQTVDDLGDPGWDQYYGHGRINALRALYAVNGGQVVGVVTSAVTGDPISKALVVANGPFGELSTHADDQGRYRLHLTAGPYIITASTFWYQEKPQGVEVVADKTEKVNFQLWRREVCTVSGQVTEKGSHRSIAGAKIKAVDTPVEAFTNQYGYYELTLPRDDTYDLAALSGAGFHSQKIEVNLAWGWGGPVVVNFALQKAPTILVVNAAYWWNKEAASTYEDGLQALGVGYDYLAIESKSDLPSAAFLSAYDIVIWVTPKTYIEKGEKELMDYLDGGGRLFIAGYDYLLKASYHRGPTRFMKEYLNTQLGTRHPETFGEFATPQFLGSGLFEGLNPTLLGRTNIAAPIHPLGHEVLSCRWKEGVVGYDKYPAPTTIAVAVGRIPFRVVALATDLESLGPPEVQVELFERVISWLAIPQLTLEVDKTSAYQDEVLNYKLKITNSTNTEAQNLILTGALEWQGTVPSGETTLPFQVKIGREVRSHVLTGVMLQNETLPGRVEADALTIVNLEVLPPQAGGDITYRWREIEYNWIDITGVSQPLYLEDSQGVEIELGFNFLFNGKPFDRLTITDDGLLVLPNGEEIKVFYKNLEPLHFCVEAGTVWWWSNGEDTLVVTWEHVPPWGYQGGYFTFQAILKADGSITFQYKELTGSYEGVVVGIPKLEIPSVWEGMAVKIWPMVMPVPPPVISE